MSFSSVELEIATEAIGNLLPGSARANLSVQVSATLPGPGNFRHTWTGSAQGVAEQVLTAVYGRTRAAGPVSPLTQAEDAKRRRDLVGEVGALMAAGTALESAPWYPCRPGDLIHIHYPPAGEMAAFGETYIVGDAGGGLLSMELLAHSLPADTDPALVQGMTGAFTAPAVDCPIYDAWFEGGPHLLTVVRDGRAVHNGDPGSPAGAALAATTLAATVAEAERYLDRGEPHLALARLRSDRPLPPCGNPGVTAGQADCARPRGHRGACTPDAAYMEPPHECPALPELLHAVLSVSPKTVSFQGLYEAKEAALDAASGWGIPIEAEVRGSGADLHYVFLNLPVPGSVAVSVVAPMRLLADPRAEDEWAAEGMATALGPKDYADDFRDVDE